MEIKKRNMKLYAMNRLNNEDYDSVQHTLDNAIMVHKVAFEHEKAKGGEIVGNSVSESNKAV